MKSTTTLLLLIMFDLSLVLVYARGGRGGVRGSIGSIFGTSRRKVFSAANSDRRKPPSSQPRYRDGDLITGTKSKVIGKSAPNIHQRQQFDYTPVMPTGGIYFRSQATIPTGAIYIPHTPQYTSSSKSSDLIEFFTGYMTGRILSKAFHNSQQVNINFKTQNTTEGAISENKTNNDELINSSSTDMNVQHSSFNKTFLEEETYQPTTESNFKRQFNNTNLFSSSQEAQMNTAFKNTSNEIPKGGIICMPMIFNETDPSENNKTVKVEKLVCFPAPPPPPPTDDKDCYETKTLLFPGESTVVTRHCNHAKIEKSDPVVGDILIADKIDEIKKVNEIDETEEDDI